MIRKLLAAVAVLVLCSSLYAQEQEEFNLSLTDALAFAMKNNFDVNISRVEHQMSEMTLNGARGIYDPVLSFSLNSSVDRQPTTSTLQVGTSTSTYLSRRDVYNAGISQLTPWGQTFVLNWQDTRSRTNSSYSLFNPTYSSNASIYSSIPLLRGFGVTNTNKYIIKARLDRQAADSSYARLLRDSLIQVEKSYWALVFAKGQYQVTQKALEVAKEFQKETAARISVGTLAPIEQVSADAQVASREEELLSAENLVINSEDLLKVVLGIRKENPEWNMAIHPTDSPDIEVRDYEEEGSIGEALKNREEIRELELGLQKTVVDTKTARINMLPSLNLDGSLSYAGSAGDYYFGGTNYFVDENFGDSRDMVLDRDYKSWAIGLTFSVPIGNRAQRFIYQNYRLVQNQAEISLEKTKQNVVSEVRNSLRNVKTSEKIIAAAKANLRLQEEKLASEKKKFDNGLSTSFNVLSYQNDVLSASTSVLKAMIDHQIEISGFEKAKGSYLRFRGIELDVPTYSENGEAK